MMAKVARKRPDLSALSAVLDRRSYEWIGDEDPELLEVIEQATAAGATPRDIRRHVIAYTERPAIAARCEQAARHVARGAGE